MPKHVTALCLLVAGLLVWPVCAQDEFHTITEWAPLFFSRGSLRNTIPPSRLQEPVVPLVTLELGYSPYYLEERSDGISRRFYLWRQRNHVVFPLIVKRTAVRFDGWLSGRYGEVDYDFNRKYGVRLRNRSIQTGVSLAFPVIRNHFFLHLGLGSNHAERTRSMEYQAGFTVFPVTGLGVQYLFRKSDPLLHLKAEYSETDYHLSIVSFQNDHLVRLQLTKPGTLHATAEARYIKDGQGNAPDQNRSFFFPEGFSKSLAADAVCSITERFRIGLAGKLSEAAYPGYLKDTGQTFGKVTRFAYSDRNMDGLLIFQNGRSRYEGSLGYGTGHFNSRGHVESWPFTDIWIDLLGYRSYFDTAFDFGLFRLGFKYAYEGQGFRFESSLTGERLMPEGYFTTWEPEFLVFGKTNLKTNILEISTQDGLYLGAGFAKIFLERFHVDYRMNQYLPLRSRKREVETTPGGTTGLKEKIRKRQYGGGQHVLRLRIYF